MIIDADEELTDMKDLLAFLDKRDLQASYGACIINVANPLSSNNKEDEAMLASPRLFKNDGYFHYKGKVHNQPVWKGNLLKLESIIKHYGYDNTDKELMERKFQRTSQLLLEELGPNPDNVYLRYQLAVSYAMHKDLKEALREIRKAYTSLHALKEDPRSSIYVYSRYADFAFASKQLEEAERICLEGISLEPEYIDLYFTLARIYEVQGRYPAAINRFEGYLGLVRNFNKLTLSSNPTVQFYTTGKESQGILELGKLYLLVEDYGASLQVIGQLIGKAAKLPPAIIEQGLVVCVEAALKSQKMKKLKDIYRQLSDPEQRNYFSKCLESHQRKMSQTEWTKLITLFAQGDGPYAKLSQIRIAFLEKRLEESQELLENLLRELDFNSHPEFYADLLFYQISLNRPLADIFNKISKEKADVLIAYMCKTQESIKSLVENYVRALPNPDGFSELRLSRLLLKNILLLGNLADMDYHRVFNLYMQAGMKYVKFLYSPPALEAHVWPSLDREDRFLLQVARADQEKAEGSYRQAIQLLRDALNTYPELNPGIEKITKELQASADSAAKEFKQYSRQIKGTIENLIKNEDLDSATSLLAE
jgi:tetratricopeptide (TPR) repeat protein